ncbi:hypothetical protein [Phycicoccus sp. Root101]|uniref:PKD domain-containing protein n=1 Tax=Phycicoccus sp. Root101 TaxID=1736421 RepID=UPI000AA5E2A2|nr:hypothetical protein [Phycicoccus sp. Root101]
MTQRRLLRGLVAVALAVPLAATLASADTISTRVPLDHLTQVGPVSSENGFPVWYRDSSTPSVRLDACLDAQDPLCGFLPGDLPDDTQPISFPDNFPEEFFYQRANATTTMPNGGKVIADLALEGAFGGGPVLDGDQMVFSRVRIKITNVPAGTTYTVIHPYGVERVTASDKNLVFVTDDVGLTPGDFTGALKGRHSPFLRWTAGAPAGYLGDPAIEHAITGSPYRDAAGQPQNYLSVVDSRGVEVARTSLFTVSGKLATNSGVTIDSATYEPDSPGSDAGILSVFASSEPGQSLQVATDPAAGIVNTTLTADDGRYFGRIHYAHKPATVKVLNAGDVPVSSKTAALKDVVTVTDASFDGTKLSVSARSSDPDAVLTVPGFGVLSGGTTTFPDVTAVPPTITVTSDRGGSSTESTVPDGGVLEPTPVIASAGADQRVQQGAAVTLDAGATSGEIASYAWSQTPADGEPVVQLTGAATARASFTAPTTETVLHFTVTTTGVSGQVDTSTSTVTVLPVPLDPPTASAGPNQSVARGTKVTLSGSATGASTYRWTQTAGDPVGPLADVVSPSFTYPTFSAARGSTNTPLAFTLTVTGPTGTATSSVQVTPVLDTTSVTTRFRTRGQWIITGTASPFAAGQTITIHAGPTLASPVLGTAVVSTADGTWSFKRDVPAQNTAPTPTVSVESTLGFTRLAIPVSVTS